MNYKNIRSNVWNAILSELALQMINGGLMLILLLYLKDQGYTDTQNAYFFASRFLGVLFFSFPFGLYIRKRKLAGFFKFASITVPIFTCFSIFAIDYKMDILIYLAFMLWGLAFSVVEISKIPFILRNSKPENHTKTITLAYATWSFGAVISGSLIFLLSQINIDFFDHRNCLLAITVLSLLGIYFSFRIKGEQNPKEAKGHKEKIRISEYDWAKIVFALTPTLILAIGAGMSVPYIPLYFNTVFEMNYAAFSGFGFIAYLAVFMLMLFTPNIKDKFGIRWSIPITQSLSVSCLIVLGFMQFKSAENYALTIALIAFILRQPLMNIAQPLTTEIIMKYVGKDNHEIAASLMAFIWNGSFVFSSIIFGILRNRAFGYATIFFCTAGLYLIAIVWYQVLIKRTLKLGVE